MKSLFLLVITFSTISFAANSGSYSQSYSAQCALRKQKLKAAFDLTKSTCVAIRDSKQCQDFYKTLEDEKDKKKARTCSDQEIEANVNGNYLGEAALACASGVIVDPIVDLGTAIGEGAAKIQIAWEKAEECNKSIDQKMAIIMSYNLDVPKLLQYPMLSKEKLKQFSCANINDSIQMLKRVNSIQLANKLRDKYNSPTGKQSLSPDELEFMDYNKVLTDDLASKRQGGIAKIVENMINKLNLKLDCYSPAQALAIRCEIAATIASVAIPGLLAVRMARLSKLTNIRLANIEKSLGELQGLSREARIAKAQNEIATLKDGEKLTKLESELGRASKPLSKKEKAAYEKAHNEGASRGESYGSYTGKTLREKKRILMEEGGFKEVEADFMINRGYVGNAPDEVITAVKEGREWKFFSEAAKGRAKQVFGKDISDNQAAAILSYRNALLKSGTAKEKAVAEAKQRMLDMGLTDKEVGSIISGEFDSAKTVANTATSTTTAPAKTVENTKPAAQSSAANNQTSLADHQKELASRLDGTDAKKVQEAYDESRKAQLAEISKNADVYRKSPSKVIEGTPNGLTKKEGADFIEAYVKDSGGGDSGVLKIVKAIDDKVSSIAGDSGSAAFKKYKLEELKVELLERHYTAKFGNKHHEIDLDKFEQADEAGYEAYQAAHERLEALRNSRSSRLWPR